MFVMGSHSCCITSEMDAAGFNSSRDRGGRHITLSQVRRNVFTWHSYSLIILLLNYKISMDTLGSKDNNGSPTPSVASTAPATAPATVPSAGSGPAELVSANDADKKRRRFNNGWTPSLEALVADWADKAQCYRWMHDKTSRAFYEYNQYMMIPVIILSTLTGTANFGMDSLFNDANSKRIAALGIGGVSIITGIITTLANFLRYAQGSEAHSTAAILWAKFNRFMCIELALNPNDRMEAFSFLKMFRVELDRLIELSPPIPESIIRSFKHEFRMLADVKRPEITGAGAIEHTRAFDNSNERLKALASEASMLIWHKKKFVKELVMADLDIRVRNIATEVAEAKLEEKLRGGAEAKKTSVIRGPMPPFLNDKSRGPKPVVKVYDTDEVTLEVTDIPGTANSLFDDHRNQYDKTGSP